MEKVFAKLFEIKEIHMGKLRLMFLLTSVKTQINEQGIIQPD